MASVLVCCAVMQVSCSDSERCSSTGYGGYIFSTEDSARERRYLQLPRTAGFTTRCLYQELPPSGAGQWREVQLDAELHRAIVELLTDPDSLPYFEADTDVSNEVEQRVCVESTAGGDSCICIDWPGNSDYCYKPLARVGDLNFNWTFGFSSEVALSTQSQELVEAFLAAHTQCWEQGTPAAAFDC